MHQLSVMLGVARYEFRMQIRRPAVWITMILLEALMIGIYSRGRFINTYIATLVAQNSLLYILAFWTITLNRLLPVGIGVLLADRLPRDRRTKVDELLTSLPGKLSARLVGKYLGSMIATLIPMFAFYAIGVGYIVYRTGNLMAIPLALETFAVITLPGILFITAFSIACPAILWVPLYQFCFVGYWFWGNELGANQGIPTLSNTILTPMGGFMAKGFYGIEAGDFTATPMQGVESIVLLIGLAIVVMFVLWNLLRWQQARQ
jgi:ABC-2 type transport system permease protein